MSVFWIFLVKIIIFIKNGWNNWIYNSDGSVDLRYLRFHDFAATLHAAKSMQRLEGYIFSLTYRPFADFKHKLPCLHDVVQQST